MRILLPAVAPSSKPDGVSRHAVNVARCLLQHTDVEHIDLAVGMWQIDAIRSLLGDCGSRLQLAVERTGRSAVARNWWYWSRMPQLARKLGSDIAHLAYPVPIKRSAFTCPVVVSLHDLYPYDIPENFGYPKVFANRMILQQCLRSVDAVACVSHNTFHRLEVHAPSVIVAKAITIYNCVTAGPQTASCSPIPGWSGERFLLCVAQHRLNKNLELSIRIFQRLLADGDLPTDTRLVMVGSDGPETRRIKQAVKRASLEDNVVLIAGISDAELKWCYAHCDLLLATSTIEGFGLPIVEAMINHCQVVCSDIPAFREVGGAYCQYVDLANNATQAFVSAIRLALHNYRYRVSHTESFSTDCVGGAYVRLYRGLLQAAALGAPKSRGERVPAFERGQP